MPSFLTRFSPTPQPENVEDGLALYYRSNCQGVVAFGGGSPIDCAKIIAAKVTNRKNIERCADCLN